MPPGPCAHFISQSFKQRVDPEGYAWAQVSKEMHELYWEEFHVTMSHKLLFGKHLHFNLCLYC